MPFTLFSSPESKLMIITLNSLSVILFISVSLRSLAVTCPVLSFGTNFCVSSLEDWQVDFEVH